MKHWASVTSIDTHLLLNREGREKIKEEIATSGTSVKVNNLLIPFIDFTIDTWKSEKGGRRGAEWKEDVTKKENKKKENKCYLEGKSVKERNETFNKSILKYTEAVSISKIVLRI